MKSACWLWGSGVRFSVEVAITSDFEESVVTIGSDTLGWRVGGTAHGGVVAGTDGILAVVLGIDEG